MADDLRPWPQWPLRERLRVIAGARRRIAASPETFSHAISASLPRSSADTLVAEVLPLLAAMRFLEQEAERILKPKCLSRRGLPLWLSGTSSEIVRASLGTVLVIGPSNYPLMLPGIQAVQALVAGNAVVWKPGCGGKAVADLLAQAMYHSGLPQDLLRVTDESVEAVETEIARGVEKVFFTGSAAVGRILLQRLSHTLTPSVMELSGCDAAIILPDADLSYVVKALSFGMRLNGSATCMAPRRILLVNSGHARRQELITSLLESFANIDGVRLSDAVRKQLHTLLAEAQSAGAKVHGTADDPFVKPILVVDAKPTMTIAQADLFAPVLSLMEVVDEAGVMEAQQACPFGLTASIFGDEQAARRLATQLVVGTVLVNDMIVSTADPRVPFGGRRQSGFGTTRGAEGLLEMTAAKTIAVRRGHGSRRFDPTGRTHTLLFRYLIQLLYAGGIRTRLRAVRRLIEAGWKTPRA